MTITVTHQGTGATVSFPDGTSPDTIKKAMRSLDGQGGEAKVKSDGYSYGKGLARTVAQGATLGSADEIAAAVSSVRPYRGSVGPGRSAAAQPVDPASRSAYDETLADERAIISQFSEENPKTAIAAQIGGGLATVPFTPVARVFQGGTLLPRIGNSMATGAAYGGAAGFNSGEGENRLISAVKGLGLGAGIGAAAPVVGTAAGNAMAAIRNRLAPVAPQLQGFERSAVDRLGQVMDQSGLTPAQAGARAQELGQRGMIADVDGAFADVTEAIAQQPGAQRQIIQQALENRAETAPATIRGLLTNNMGPAANIPRTIRNLEQQYGQQAAPLYAQFYQTRIPQDRPLQAIVDRVRRSEPGAFNRALRMAVADGHDPRYLINLRNDPMTPMTGVQGQQAQRIWQGVELDYLKRAIDDLARNADPGSNEQRIFGNLARTLRTTVDAAINPQNPAQSVWAQARAIAGDGLGAREAIEEGRSAFGRGLTADQLAEDMAARSALERDAYTIGAREQLRATMDTAATNFGPRGDTAARRMLNSDENRRKLRTLIGPQDARNITRGIDAENQMAETYNQVLSNSATARRQAGRDIVPRQYDGSNMRQVRNSSLSGLAMEGIGRLANIVTANALNERNARIATDMARMLVSQGVARDDIIRGLQVYARRQGVTQQQRAQVEGFIQGLIRSTTPAAALQDGP